MTVTTMHRLAIITDVHGDVDALTDAIARAAELHVDTIVCAGDLVDYGASP